MAVIIDGQEIDNLTLARNLIGDTVLTNKKDKMVEAEKYYEVQNTHIATKKKEYSVGRGQKVENETASNVKLPNAFYRKAVQQKTNYAFGKPPVIAVDPIDPDYTNDEEKEKYQREWGNLLNASNRKAIKTLSHFAINCGIGYVYLYMNDKGFHIVNVPSPAIRPSWTDITHTELNALLRLFPKKVIENGEPKIKNTAELWTNEDVTYFDYESSLTEITTENHMKVDEVEGKSWDRVPFLWLKGTYEEMPLLYTVKAYIDSYDDLNSQSVDTLRDDLECAVIFKNYDPNVGSLVQALQTLKDTKVGAVDADGGIDLLKNNPDITAIQQKLEHLKKDINEFSSTVDIQDIQFGNNPSGVAIKAAFQDTDTYINDIEMEFELFIENLKYFYDKYLDWTGKIPLSVSSKYKVTATLNRDMMINETELIENTAKLSGLVSQKTLDEYNPAVENHETEQERREAELEEEAKKDNPYPFPEPVEDEPEIEPEKETITETERVKE